MPARNRSLSTQLILTLVLVTTIILAVYAVLAMEVYRKREMAKMQTKLSVATEHL